jgi:hypothetical protein
MKILDFFLFLWVIFALLDPDPQFECGSGSSNSNKCGSVSGYGSLGVSPEIKFVSFGVRRLKNRSVTPNGEEIKDKKGDIWASTNRIWIRICRIRTFLDLLDTSKDPAPGLPSQTKIVRKTLISTVLSILYNFGLCCTVPFCLFLLDVQVSTVSFRQSCPGAAQRSSRHITGS